MAQTGTSTIDPTSAYAYSFGNLKHETRYNDVTLGVDMRGEFKQTYDANVKAMTVSGMGAGTTDKAIIPIYLDPLIVDVSRKFTPLVEIIPRVSNMGITADFVQLTKGSGYTAAEDAALTDVNDTYVRVSKPIKFLYAVGRITGPSLAAIPSFMMSGITASGGTPEGTFGTASAPNGMQLEILAKTREIKELEENLILNGNATTSALGGPNGTEYDGIIVQMGTTNRVDKNTSALALSDIHTAVKEAFDDGGRPNLAVCSSGVYTDLQNLITAKFGYLQAEKNIFWGYTALTLRTMVGEIPVIPSMFMSNSSGSKAMYFLDLSVIELRVLQDLTYEKLAKTNDSDKFMLKIYETLIIRNPAFCSFIGRISA
jgi:hypothetical protein